MEIFLVGGAVRDALLARDAEKAAHVDRDWVVVGATPETMVAQGFLPVGRDFPVFLHPQTREEYALARTERKTAPGYHGFAFHAAPGVTLQDDLARRDLTINAMAAPQAQANDLTRATLVDPYGGQRDLRERVLRHVSSAFAEDPVRILRLARFAARFPDFSVAPETMTLMRSMVEHGEVDHLVPERVWQELSRGLMEQQPSRLFEVLRDCGALARLLPEVDHLWGAKKWGSDSNSFSSPHDASRKLESDPHCSDAGAHLMGVLDMSAHLGASLPVRFACLCHDLGPGRTTAEILASTDLEQHSARLIHNLCARWRVPRESRELADVVAREHGHIHRSGALNAAAVLRLLERCDAIRRPERFAEVLLACECEARGRPGLEGSAYPQRDRLLRVLDAARSVNTETIASQIAASLPPDASPAMRAQLGPRIAQAIHAARAHRVAQGLAEPAGPGTASPPPRYPTGHQMT